jgi:hypothetical protein
MSMTLSGDGSITGLVAGGLPDASVVDADLSLAANSAPIKTALNASGDAPIYACRAWVNFNGTGTVAIRASGNVSSITDNGTGTYVVNLTTSLQDSNGAPAGTSIPQTAGTGNNNRNVYAAQITTNQIRVNITENNVNTFADSEFISVAIFR